MMTACLHRRSRRQFLRSAAACLAVPIAAGAAGKSARTKVAAVFTEFRHRSHAHVILENFLEPYLFNGRRTQPGVEVVSFYADQIPARDMARDVARTYGIPLFSSIADALCLGGKELAVDAVLSIGEHGAYPINEKGQRQYPRKRFFDEIVAVFRRSGRVVPLFNDKHLSYRWDWAREMYDTAVALKIPFMAGSSVPLAERRPPVELRTGAQVTEAVAIHGGNFESYDFHGLEALQSMVESRARGETGVRGVHMLEGAALWKAAADGLWSPALADAALAAELGPGKPTLKDLVKQPGFQRQPLRGILVSYSDGLRGVVLTVGQSATRWNFACRLAGDERPLATRFHTGPWQNRNLFKALAHAIQAFFRERRPPYPVERTLLTTGVLAAAVDSRHAGGKAIDTPHLKLAYRATDFRPFRETGASWRILTGDVPEPVGIDRR